jgi:hypothetical protein
MLLFRGCVDPRGFYPSAVIRHAISTPIDTLGWTQDFSERIRPDARRPATGEAIHIKASKKVAFRAAKELKEKV